MGTIDGVLIQLGGKDKYLSRSKMGTRSTRCNTDHQVARQWALSTAPGLRFVGIGTWQG